MTESSFAKLGRDELSFIANLIDKNSLFAFLLTCRATRDAVFDMKKPIITTYDSVITSVTLFRWANQMGASKKLLQKYLLLIFNNKNYRSYLSYEYLDYIVANGFELPTTNMCIVAALSGKTEVLKWMRNHNYPWNEWTCSMLALFGKVELLRYARKKGCRWDEQTIYSAVESGCIEMVRYVHKHGCPWHVNTFVAALPNIEIMRYVRRHGCPINEIACIKSASIGNLKALKYIYKHTRTNPQIFKNNVIWKEAEKHDHIHILMWMNEKHLYQ